LIINRFRSQKYAYLTQTDVQKSLLYFQKSTDSLSLEYEKQNIPPKMPGKTK
jgi:hypothetical protein